MLTRQASTLIVSAGAHVFAIVALLVASAFAPGLLPTPVQHVALALAAPRRVAMADIPLPPARPRATVAATTPVPSTIDLAPPRDAAPVVPPTGIAPETAGDTSATSPSAATSVEASSQSVDGNGLLPAVPPPVQPDRAPVRLHSGMAAPVKIVDVQPRYPEIARQARQTGVVILEVVIDVHGDVASARVLRSVPLLDNAALDAVKGWKFQAARLNGEAVPVVMTVTVNFKLEQ